MAAPAPLHASEPDPAIAELIAARPHLSMHAMDGLVMEDVPLNAIADALGTPDLGLWRRHHARPAGGAAAALAGLRAHVHYAVKANDHLAVLRVFAAGGAGADVVSDGELRRARARRHRARHIVFSGVGKTAAELRAALAEDIGQINVESAAELEMISAVASAMGRTADIALRVNPDVDAGTHAKITTGRADNKFGIPYADAAALYAHAATLPGIAPVGIALHIGSQILSLAPYRAAYARAAELVRELRAAGQHVLRMDCGGGLGIGYRDDSGATPAAFAGALRAAFAGLGPGADGRARPLAGRPGRRAAGHRAC